MRSQNATDDFGWFSTATSVGRRRVAVHMGSLTVSDWADVCRQCPALDDAVVALECSGRQVVSTRRLASLGAGSTSRRGHLVNQRVGVPGNQRVGVRGVVARWFRLGASLRSVPAQPAGLGGAGS